MNSEKVKEIKDKLQEEIFIATRLDDKLRRVETKDLQDILTLINELESENERIKNIGLNEDITVSEYLQENKQLKDQIAELEHKCDDCAGCTAWKCDCANIERHAVEQFAERLKGKAIRRQEFIGELAIDDIEYVKTQDIDETLKEFIK